MAKALKYFLSLPVVSWSCFFLALLFRIGFLRIFLNIGPDKSALLVSTRNLLEGHGITIDQVDLSDLSHKIYVSFQGWPPGYNLLLSPFLYLLQDNYMLAVFLLDTLITVIFFIYLRKLLLHIGFPLWLLSLFLLFHGLFIHPYTFASNPTDFLSMAFLLIGTYHAMLLYQNKNVTLNAVFTGIFWMASAFTRYQNMAVVLILSITLLWVGIRQSNAKLRSTSAILLSIFVGLFGIWFLYQENLTGSIAYMPAGKWGLFPSNLHRLYPVMPASFLNIDFYCMQLSLTSGLNYTFWQNLFYVLGYIILLVFVLISIRWAITQKYHSIQPNKLFFLLAGIASFVTIGLLILLSISHDRHIGPPLFEWTYVVNGRYYAVPMIFAQILMFWYFFQNNILNRLMRRFRYAFIVILFIEATHGVYYLAKKLSAPMLPIAQSQWKNKEMLFTYNYIQNQKRVGKRAIVVTGLFPQFSYLADWYRVEGFFDPLKLNTAKLRTSQPVRLLVALHSRELYSLQSFLNRSDVKFIDSVSGYYFYCADIDP